jgi:hypothetical protein
VDLDQVNGVLTDHLRHDPEGRPFDDDALDILDRFLRTAAAHERLLLPRRMQRALDPIVATTDHWAEQARRIACILGVPDTTATPLSTPPTSVRTPSA